MKAGDTILIIPTRRWETPFYDTIERVGSKYIHTSKGFKFDKVYRYNDTRIYNWYESEADYLAWQKRDKQLERIKNCISYGNMSLTPNIVNEIFNLLKLKL